MITLNELINCYINYYGSFGMIPPEFNEVMVELGGISSKLGMLRLVGADVYCSDSGTYSTIGDDPGITFIEECNKTCELVEIYFACDKVWVTITDIGFTIKNGDVKKEIDFPTGSMLRKCNDLINKKYPSWKATVKDIEGVGSVIFHEDGSLNA